MITYILFFLGFFFLIKGADFLVNGASSIAKKFKISSLVIGLTIVAFGTSAPEFIVSVFASIKGTSEIAIGNILGSNIANILLILGISSLIYPIMVQKEIIRKGLPFSLLAAILVWVVANDVFIDGESHSLISRIDGLIFLSFFIIFLYSTFLSSNNKEEISKEENNKEEEIKVYSGIMSTFLVLIGLSGLTIGGKWIIDGAVEIANLFQISESLVGLTIIAIGTSLPELATSAVAAFKKQSDIAVGNVVGSNIFNIFWVLGFSAFVRPLPFSPKLNIDISMVIFSSLLLFLIMYVGKKRVIERWQGSLMVIIYFIYITILIING